MSSTNSGSSSDGGSLQIGAHGGRVEEGVVSSTNSGSSSDGGSLKRGVYALVCAACANCREVAAMGAGGMEKTSGDMYETSTRPRE